jgi:hypothetical protein
MMPIDIVLKDRIEEACCVLYQDHQIWYRLSEPRADELLIFPIWSSYSNEDLHTGMSKYSGITYSSIYG